MTRNKRCPSPALTRCTGREGSGVSALLLAAAVVLAGCPSGGGGGGASDFDRGFDEGFTKNDPYYLGYDDSWRTAGFNTFYQGSKFPPIGDNSYQDGFNEGQFTAYNDGYFVAYSYAFIIGFSEGYDNAFWDDYVEFLQNDRHTEFRNGGFDDGYDDGFSEGRIFGGFDFSDGRGFDWLDALLDWESGTDLFLEEVPEFGVGTGPWSPVVLYEYGMEPRGLKRLMRRSSGGLRALLLGRSAIRSKWKGKAGIEFARPLTVAQEEDLLIVPPSSLRDGRELGLTTTWLQRIRDYNSAELPVSKRGRRSQAAPQGLGGTP